MTGLGVGVVVGVYIHLHPRLRTNCTLQLFRRIHFISSRLIYNVKEHDYIISELNLCKQCATCHKAQHCCLSTGRNKSFKNTEKIRAGQQSVGLIGNVISCAVLSVRINKTQIMDINYTLWSFGMCCIQDFLTLR